MISKRLKTWVHVLCTLTLLITWLHVQPARASSFVVNHVADDANSVDKNPGDGVCLSWYNTCTLRAAIEEANALGGAHTITFLSPMNIYLNPSVGSLQLQTQIRLDASGMWDSLNDMPGVSISGVDQSFICLALYGSNIEIYGLSIYNCAAAIAIYSSNNTVGGALSGYRNVLSGNSGEGVYIANSAAHHNVVAGNWIGLSVTGGTKSPNAYGVRIANGAHDNTIGGSTPEQGNYISGNTFSGIRIHDSGTDGNLVSGNYIGLPAVGYASVGNGYYGIEISYSAQNNQVGGLSGSGIGNTISGNDGHGIFINNANNNYVQANDISYNDWEGVSIYYGAHNLIEMNTIHHNGYNGVRVDGATAVSNTLRSNSIHHNTQKGIELYLGGNTELAPPVINSVDGGGATGTACAWCIVELFSDSSDEGETYHGYTMADGSGNWVYTGFLSGSYVTATSTDTCPLQNLASEGTNRPANGSCGNTSEFSSAVSILPPTTIYLPLVMK